MEWSIRNGKHRYGPYELKVTDRGYIITGPGIQVAIRFMADTLEQAKAVAEGKISPYLTRYERRKKINSRYSGKGTRLYRIWEGIKSRTQNQNDKDYHHYGARGITMHRDWSASFKRFERWALTNGYDDDMTIDREDNDKGYSPENCRWISMKEQANNRRTNVLVKYKGEEKTLMQWCEELGFPEKYQTMYTRLCRGKRWTPERAFNTP